MFFSGTRTVQGFDIELQKMLSPALNFSLELTCPAVELRHVWSVFLEVIFVYNIGLLF